MNEMKSTDAGMCAEDPSVCAVSFSAVSVTCGQPQPANAK